jgi:hypothetical protein
MDYRYDVSPLKPFCPLANEPPTSFLQDVPVEMRAACLLLGCGDPRKILFSLFYDQNKGKALTRDG